MRRPRSSPCREMDEPQDPGESMRLLALYDGKSHPPGLGDYFTPALLQDSGQDSEKALR